MIKEVGDREINSVGKITKRKESRESRDNGKEERSWKEEKIGNGAGKGRKRTNRKEKKRN